MNILHVIAITGALLTAAPSASALDLTQRQIAVSGKLTVTAASKTADKIVAMEAKATAPIYLKVTATEGSAQGVSLIADTIRSIESPVVAVVTTQVHGAGSALAVFADKVVLYPSAGLVFTELPYEGVKKPKPPTKEVAKGAEDTKDANTSPSKGAAKAKAPETLKPEEKLMQSARTSYLDRFNARLARRLKMKTKGLEVKLAEGGFILTASEAVSRKIADEVVERITFTQLPVVKRERKVTTTEERTRMIQPKAD